MSRGSPLFDNVTLVSISGIIGVGKSTAITLLEENPEMILKELYSPPKGGNTTVHLCFVKEPSKKWRKHGWTKRFYANPIERALSFQLLIFTTHVDAVRKAVAKKKLEIEKLPASKAHILCIVERSMWDQLLFWKIQGSDPMDDDAYMRTWRKWNEFLPPISKIFFCKTSDLNATMQRVQLRASLIEEEKDGVSIEYQTLLYEKHCEWYTEGTTNISYQDGKYARTEKSIKCVHLNTDLPYHEDEGVLQELGKKLAEELNEFIS